MEKREIIKGIYIAVMKILNQEKEDWTNSGDLPEDALRSAHSKIQTYFLTLLN